MAPELGITYTVSKTLATVAGRSVHQAGTQEHSQFILMRAAPKMTSVGFEPTPLFETTT